MGRAKYTNPKEIRYFSERYQKWVVVEEGFPSDGASGAVDIYSQAWWVHDKLCVTGTWNDGTPVTNWQASTVLSDILASEGRWFRSMTWWVFTWALGCRKARKNGMF